jgi:uncharacterized membrane protein (UPF0182 family)
MEGNSDPGSYGQLNVYETPSSTTGPANADAEIVANNTVSKDISLLDRNGSEVLLGNTLMVPVGQSMVYLRPLYVAATTNPQPTLNSVVGVLGRKVYIESSLQAVLSDLFKTNVTVGGSSPSTPSSGSSSLTGSASAAVQSDLSQAQTDYQNAQAALQLGQLGTYQTDIAAMEKEITTAQAASQAATGSTSSTTTTTVKPSTKSTKSKSTSKSTVPTSTEPTHATTTTTTLASATAKS